METRNRLIIKKTIEQHPEAAQRLNAKLNTDELKTAIKVFAELTGISETFIGQNLRMIRIWI